MLRWTTPTTTNKVGIAKLYLVLQSKGPESMQIPATFKKRIYVIVLKSGLPVRGVKKAVFLAILAVYPSQKPPYQALFVFFVETPVK